MAPGPFGKSQEYLRDVINFTAFQRTLKNKLAQADACAREPPVLGYDPMKQT
jgi:hypothetical protein